MRIIVAEQDTVACSSLEAELRRLGHKVLAARDCEEAWALYGAAGADVIICDGAAPEVGGFELCRRIRSGDAAFQPYILLLGDPADDAYVRRGTEAGADDFLVRPIDVATLAARLAVAGKVGTLHRRLARQQAEIEAMTEALFAQARTDPLTGLSNRLCLSEDLPRVAEGVAAGDTYCAIMCAIDHFRLYNDAYGPRAGDAALRKVAASIKDNLRASDCSYRYGSGEFLVIAAVASKAEAEGIGERFRTAVEKLAEPHAKSQFGRLTLSVGAAMTPAPGPLRVAAWLNVAAAALDRSKQEGRNRHTLRCAA